MIGWTTFYDFGGKVVNGYLAMVWQKYLALLGGFVPI